MPRGSAVQLLPNGFIVQRDGSGPAAERTWKAANGIDSGLSTLRYRIGLDSAGQLAIVDTLTFVDLTNVAGTLPAAQTKINGALQQTDFDPKAATDGTSTGGTPFNGVLYFEGNVRVRGTIPTSVQLTLVSGATIYVDGPIVKGTTGNEVTGTPGPTINGLPTAALMLMARDNVAVNTTMFFGPSVGQALESVNDSTGSAIISPVRLRAAGGGESGHLELLADLGLDPGTTTNPQTWSPYALTYRRWDNTGAGLPTQFLLGSTMDDGTASASFLALDANFGIGNSPYLFPAIDPTGLITNTAAAYTGITSATTTIPLYGLGAEPWQHYARFELRSFPLLADPTGATYDANTGKIAQTGQAYTLLSGTNDLLLRPGAIAGVSSNDTLVGRSAVTPADVRIEASLFAEEGSFFVIPGPWFDPNPNDTHAIYAQRIADLQNSSVTQPPLNAAQANFRAAQERLEAYGAGPGVPFYGEPLDVRLNIVGSVAENLPPPASVQAEWQRKWGWIPRPRVRRHRRRRPGHPAPARPRRLRPGQGDRRPERELRAQPHHPVRPGPRDGSGQRSQQRVARRDPHGRVRTRPAAHAASAGQPQAVLLRRSLMNPLRRLFHSTALLGLAALGARAGAQTQSFVPKTKTVNAAVLLLDADFPPQPAKSPTTGNNYVYGQTAAPFAFYNLDSASGIKPDDWNFTNPTRRATRPTTSISATARWATPRCRTRPRRSTGPSRSRSGRARTGRCGSRS